MTILISDFVVSTSQLGSDIVPINLQVLNEDVCYIRSQQPGCGEGGWGEGG